MLSLTPSSILPPTWLTLLSIQKCQQTMSEVAASLGYKVTVVATGTDDVRSLLDDLKADPSRARLQHQVNDGGAAGGSSTTTTGSVDAAMGGTSIPHFADLVSDQDFHSLEGVTPVLAGNSDSHLVALGPNGFFFCSCLMLLTKGQPCRNGIKAMEGKEGVGFNGACVASRWRASETAWTMEALAAKSANLASTTSGGNPVGEQHPTDDAHPGNSKGGNENVGATVYADSVAFEKEFAELTWELKTTEAHFRLVYHLEEVAKRHIAVEVESHKKQKRDRWAWG